MSLICDTCIYMHGKIDGFIHCSHPDYLKFVNNQYDGNKYLKFKDLTVVTCNKYKDVVDIIDNIMES